MNYKPIYLEEIPETKSLRKKDQLKMNLIEKVDFMEYLQNNFIQLQRSNNVPFETFEEWFEDLERDELILSANEYTIEMICKTVNKLS